MKLDKKRIFSLFLIILGSFLIINTLFFLLYQTDNKYTSSAPRGERGTLAVTGQDLQQNRVIPVIDGWRYYSGQLYTPQELETGTLKLPDIIFIGQFGNFSENNISKDTFGQATYSITIQTSGIDTPLVLAVPEVFSASKIWVNGVLAAENGQTDRRDYLPHIQERVVSIPSGGAKIVVQAANYSHYYSGVTYPPMLGTADSVSGMIMARVLFYGFFCFFSLGAACASCFLWFRRKKPLFLSFGLLAVCFAIWMSYPFQHLFGAGPVKLTYIIEDTAYFAVILCMVLITHHLCGNAMPRKLYRGVLFFSIVMCGMPAICLLAVFPLIAQAVSYYGLLLNLGKVLLCVYLLTASVTGCLKKNASVWLLAGNAVFAAGILTDFLTSGHFEPIYFGWQGEYSAFLMVVLFTVLMARCGRSMIKENERLTENLQSMVDEKTRHLTTLLDERKHFLSSVAHDLKAPVTVIKTYTDFIRQGDVEVDKELRGYLDIIDRKSLQMQSSISGLQIFNLENEQNEKKTAVNLNTFLTTAHKDIKPYADANGIYFHLTLPPKAKSVFCQKNRLYRAIENIVLNATEYTPANGHITVTLQYKKDFAVIEIKDTGCGIAQENIARIFDYSFSTNNDSDTDGLRGLGLYFTRLTVEELGGSISVCSKEEEGAVFTLRIPVVTAPSPKEER